MVVTGSSGYVGSDLVHRLKNEFNVFGVDQSFSKYTEFESSIESYEFKKCMDQFGDKELAIINLAAARFNFGASAMDYYRLLVGLESFMLFICCIFGLRLHQVSHSTFRSWEFLKSYYSIVVIYILFMPQVKARRLSTKNIKTR